MGKHIIELSFKDVEYLKGRYSDAKKALAKMTDDACKRLADLGVEIAKVEFFQAEYDGVNDAPESVHTEKRENGYAVVADGKTVLFIELGTGIHYPDADLSQYIGAGGMVHGSYGKGLGNNDYWYYTGMPGNAGGELARGRINTTRTHGNKANMSMYNTVKRLEEEVERIITECFDLYD